MIVILSHTDDPHAYAVAAALKGRSTPFVTVNADTPAATSLELTIISGQTAHLIIDDARASHLTILNRRAVEYLDEQRFRGDDPARFAASELLAGLVGAFDTVPSTWINHPLTNIRARHKIVQLVVAARLGFPIPPSLLANRVERVVKFAESEGQSLIYKTIGVHQTYETGRVYTTPIDVAAIEQPALDHCPAFLQSRLEKRRDIRVTVVAGRLFGASADVADSHVDWRYANAARWQAWTVPPHVEHFIAQITAHFQLHFAAIDFVETAAGEVVFLEVNPNGQWLWLQAETGHDIAAALADLLTSLDASSP